MSWAAAGRADEDRPLTDEGRQRMFRLAAALARLEPELDWVLTSPYRRAVETAQILGAALPEETRIEVVRDLAPGGDPWPLLLRLVASPPVSSLVALVGHAPDLPILAGRLLGSGPRPVVELKKGGAALLDLGDRLDNGQARLLWLLPPGILRRAAS